MVGRCGARVREPVGAVGRDALVDFTPHAPQRLDGKGLQNAGSERGSEGIEDGHPFSIAHRGGGRHPGAMEHNTEPDGPTTTDTTTTVMDPEDVAAQMLLDASTLRAAAEILAEYSRTTTGAHCSAECLRCATRLEKAAEHAVKSGGAS